LAKTASLLSILLLSSALLTTGCNQTSSPGDNTGRRADIVPNGGGRAQVMNIDQRTTDQRNANQTARTTSDRPGDASDQARFSALGQNGRVDTNISARVGRIEGIRSATVLVSGDAAFVMVATNGNKGSSVPGRPATTATDRGTDPGRDPDMRADVPRSIERQRGVRTNDVGNSTLYFTDDLETDVKSRVSDEIIRANPAIRNVYFVNRWR
jgi:hypothetical protein